MRRSFFGIMLLLVLPSAGMAQQQQKQLAPILTGPRQTVAASHTVARFQLQSDTVIGKQYIAPVRGKKIVEGAIIGFTAGALLGGIIGVLGDHDNPGSSGSVSTLSIVAFGLPGAVLGAGIAFIRESRRD